MDDPFGPSIVIFTALALAAVVRMAEAAVPFIDEGEAEKRAVTGDAKARRALRMVARAEKPFGEFRMGCPAPTGNKKSRPLHVTGAKSLSTFQVRS